MTGILAMVVVLRLYSDQSTTAGMKIPWILLIALFPVMGLSLYLMLEVFHDIGKTGKQLSSIQKELRIFFEQKESVMEDIGQQDLAVANQSRYLWKHTTSPVYGNTQACYYGDASEAFEALKAEAERAEEFIFLEYFIVNEGSSFQELMEILERKAGQGVEVRLMYDDIGSIGYAVKVSEWGKGYGSVILRLGLEIAREKGMEKVLLNINENNVASIKVCEKAGGKLQDTININGEKNRRYWIEL